MNSMIFVALILLGLVLGSFANATVWRLHEQERLASRPQHKKQSKNGLKLEDLSILDGRSMCTHCHHPLSAIDLIPVVSYVALRGKCRYCHKPIEDTPLPELVLPVLFVASYMWWPYQFGSIWSMGNILFYVWVVSLVGFIILTIYDLRWFILPDRVVFPLLVLALVEVAGVATVFGGGWPIVLDAMWGIVCLAGLFWLLYVTSRGRWIGFGDVKLAIVIGLLVGGPVDVILVLFIASLIGSIIALPMLVRRQATATTKLPFGPLLLAATVIVMLYGGYITNWYSTFLLMR